MSETNASSTDDSWATHPVDSDCTVGDGIPDDALAGMFAAIEAGRMADTANESAP